MQVSKISISNILGVESIEFEPGKVTEISGKNGEGKTSILEAIKSVIKGGHDATLLRKGAEKGEVVLVLDNGMTITKRVTEGKSDTIVERDGMKAARPAETIKALVDALSANPIEFLRAPEKERVKVLLEAMPLQADLAKLSDITGVDAGWLGDMHAMDAIAQLHKQIYDERTGDARAAKEKQGTITQLSNALPPETAQDMDGNDGNMADLNNSLDAIVTAKDQEIQRISEKLTDLQECARTEIQQLEAQIAAVKEKYTAQEARATEARRRAMEKYEHDKAAIRQKMEAINAKVESRARHAQTLETIKTLREEAANLEGIVAKKTASLAALDAYKTELLSSLPVPGLEVVNGKVLRNGIPFDRLNTAQQVQVAIEIAKLRAGKLGLICVDGIELLDPSSYSEFKQQALDSGLQMIIARVDSNHLSINKTTNA
jgi:DNA repair exonuclease SbcCD ATPase subunit